MPEKQIGRVEAVDVIAYGRLPCLAVEFKLADGSGQVLKRPATRDLLRDYLDVWAAEALQATRGRLCWVTHSDSQVLELAPLMPDEGDVLTLTDGGQSGGAGERASGGVGERASGRGGEGTDEGAGASPSVHPLPRSPAPPLSPSPALSPAPAAKPPPEPTRAALKARWDALAARAAAVGVDIANCKPRSGTDTAGIEALLRVAEETVAAAEAEKGQVPG